MVVYFFILEHLWGILYACLIFFLVSVAFALILGKAIGGLTTTKSPHYGDDESD